MEYRYFGSSGLKVSVLGFGNMTSGMEMFKGKKDIVTPELEQANFYSWRLVSKQELITLIQLKFMVLESLKCY